MARKRRILGYYLDRDRWISPPSWNLHRGSYCVIRLNLGCRSIGISRDDGKRRRDIIIGTVGKGTTERYERRAALIGACSTPYYHETHRYCPSCPWTEADGVPTS